MVAEASLPLTPNDCEIGEESLCALGGGGPSVKKTKAEAPNPPQWVPEIPPKNGAFVRNVSKGSREIFASSL